MSNEKQEQVRLFVVSTPIGNLKDFSQRAVDVLKNVDMIACEDCRTSTPLLRQYDINTKLVSYHKFNEKQRTEEFLELINSGKKIVLISDAGTPCISDPGRILVKELFDKGVKITSIPGASAITAFLSIVPRECEEFSFAGFLPRAKNQQVKLFEKYRFSDLVFYESPNRLQDTLENIASSRGCEAEIAVGRELTKMFEEVKKGTVKEVSEYYKNNVLKGEIVCLLYSASTQNADDYDIEEKINKLKALKYSDKDISTILSTLYDMNKNKIYKMLLGFQNK